MACKKNIYKDEKRESGVLLHITSLPSTPGIGTMGKEAYKFVDWLKSAGQTLWQILPLGPTGYGDSPYASFSTFAGNPLIIDLDNLVSRGWAKAEDIEPADYIKSEGKIEYGSVVWWKTPVLYKCAEYFIDSADKESKKKFEEFKEANDFWLSDFAAFTSIKKSYEGKMWSESWSKELASHDDEAIRKWNEENSSDVEKIKAIQFFFFTQWLELKKYANDCGIRIIGDIPIFVAGDSADVWANQKLFQINTKTLKQKTCAGVPPDYFSATGQLWGNPLYNWSAMKDDNYSWWIARIKNMLNLVDVIRIDHFRGFEAYWQIPYGEETAINGKWMKGPGMKLFDAVTEQLGALPIIAEDLGLLTPQVEKLRDKSGFPGMKILQFAFNEWEWSEESEKNAYLPGNYKNSHCVVYTGTHDNDTTMGLLSSSKAQFKKNIVHYFNLDEEKEYSDKDLCDIMVEQAFKSKAFMCMVPLQDVYYIGSEGRMNTPSTAAANWAWRMSPTLLDQSGAAKLRALSEKYSRIPENN